MKITAFILLVFALHLSAATLAQNVTLTEHKAPLEKVLNDIRGQSGYAFFYNQDWMQQAQPVEINVKNMPLDEALKVCFKDQPFDYAVVNKTIVLKLKEKAVVSPNVQPAAQAVTVTGKVQNELGEPMAGVTVKQKDNPSNGTVTDAKGNYSINVPDGKTLIVFSYIGYEIQELQAGDIAAGSVMILKVAENNLHEVIINKGYYDEKRALSTGDVSVVDAKTISEQPVSDPLQALEGRVPGLYIQQTSGLPGAYATVLLRGKNSIFNGNDPLYVIDGVPFTATSLTNSGVIGGGSLGTPSTTTQSNGAGMSPFNALNPDDIENIEVLKDADATAIYGSQGANGVILITTKKGKPGNTIVNFDISQGDGNVTRTMDLMNTQQYLEMRHQAFSNDGLSPSLDNGDFDLLLWDTTRNTNWQKVLIGNTAHYTNAQVSISGGSENTQFYVGGGFNRQTTVFPGDFDDIKGALNFNLTHSSANKRFQMQLSAGYVNENNNVPISDLTSTALELAPDAPALYTANGSLNWSPFGGNATFNNPLFGTFQTASSITNNLTSNLRLSYLIIPGLKVSGSFGYTDDRMNQSLQTPAFIFPPPYNIGANASNNYGTSEFSNWIIEPQINYNSKIAKGQLSVLVGSTFKQTSTNSQSYLASGFSSDALISNPENASTLVIGGANNILYRYNAVYARVGYTWDDKYLLNITARRDGSSRFGSGKQWGDFGAVGAGWVFSKEKFIEDSFSWLSFGKLRGSYGITGNDEIADYQYLSSYTANSPNYAGGTGLYPTRLANPYFGWEVNKKLEGGVELGFLKDRINFAADYYRNRSGNQLIQYSLPTTTGFSSIEENLPAVVQNTGVELSLNTINIKSKSFTWSSSFNITVPSNKLVSYPGLATSSYSEAYFIGKSLFTPSGYSGVSVNPITGIYQYASANGLTSNPSFPADWGPLTPITQQFYGGFQNSFSYKGFQLDIFFQFVKQTGYNYLQYVHPSEYGTVNFNAPVAALSRWQNPGDITMYGRFSTQFGGNDPAGDLTSSDFTIGDASFIRLKNVALSYNLPTNWVKTLHIRSLRIYMQAQDLLTITNYFGLDPETQGIGLPPLRMITLGVHASL